MKNPVQIWMNSLTQQHDTLVKVDPCKICAIFTGDKPWTSKSLKQLLNQRKVTLYQGESTQKKRSSSVKREIKQAKLKYKDKVEREPRTGSSGGLERHQIDGRTAEEREKCWPC